MEWKSTEVKLKHPIEYNAKLVTKITVREPSVDVMEQLEALGIGADGKTTMAQVRGMVCAFSGEDAELIKKLHIKDFTEVGEACAPFMEEAMQIPLSTNSSNGAE